MAGALLVSAWSGPGLAEPPAQAGQFILAARQYLGHGDGIGAEVQLRRALEAGASRETVAAYMGEAFIQQDALEKARRWLEPGQFSSDSAAVGYRALGKLEQQEGNLPAAGRAFDRAIKLTPRDATMWVEIGRLRYAGTEHVLAIEAADYALELDPQNVRALEFRGQIVRDQLG
ncbi:MAG: tetratricopeptide repeat protein, partial [Novosphingobium sp.]|nr:tetratricopeptide repeat protein [Novosphingobium sp.]